jgi:hypothetical protein
MSDVSVASFNALINSFQGIDDPVLLLQALQASKAMALGDTLSTYSESAKRKMARLDQLQQLAGKLSALQPASDGASTLLGPDVGSAEQLQDEAASLGYSLSGQQRCPLLTVTTAKNGDITYERNTPLATPEEMRTAQSAPLLYADYQGMEVHRVTHADGSVTDYGLTLSKSVLTATNSEVANVQAAIAAAGQLLQAAIATETRSIEGLASALGKTLKEDAARLPKAIKRQDETLRRREDAHHDNHQAVQQQLLDDQRLARATANEDDK